MKKKTIILFLIIALCLVGCGKKEKDKEEVKKTGPLRLEKLNDYDVVTTQTLYFKSKDNYMFLSSYSRLNGKDTFTIFKDGEVIKEVKGDVRELTDGRFVLREKDGEKFTFIDYDDIGIDEETVYNFAEYAGDNNVAVKKGKKAGLVTTEGKVVIDFKYDELAPVSQTIIDGNDTSLKYYKYLLACKNGKVGVIDFEDNVIVPFEYDRIKYDADWDAGYYLGTTSVISGKVFFFLKSNKTEYVFNESGKLILEGKNVYNDSEHFYTTGKSEYDRTYYDLDGKEISNVKFQERDMTGLGYPDIIRMDVNLEIFVSKNKVVFFDEKNARHEIENVHHAEYDGYYITDYVYFVDIKNGVELRSLKDGELIDTYDSVHFTESDSFLVCKDKKCGLIDYKGKEILPVEYEEKTGEVLNYPYYKKDNEYAVVSNGEVYKYTCSEGNSIENDVLRATDKYYFGYDKKEHTYMYNNKCEKVETGRLRNYFVIDDLSIIIAELWDSQESRDGRDTYEYVFFSDEGEVITFENKDEAKISFYIGSIDGTPYFLTDKGMYYLTNE